MTDETNKLMTQALLSREAATVVTGFCDKWSLPQGVSVSNVDPGSGLPALRLVERDGVILTDGRLSGTGFSRDTFVDLSALARETTDRIRQRSGAERAKYLGTLSKREL